MPNASWRRRGVARRFLLFGLVSPARLRICPTVLAAGQLTFGFIRSSRALSFLAPQDGKRFRSARISFSISADVAYGDRLVTFQVMRRTLGTDMQQHGTLKDTQGMLRHASIKTTGDVYVQTIEESVLAAVNSRTSAVLGDWRMPEQSLGLKGRNLKGLNVIRRSSAKSIRKVAVSA